MASVPTKNGSIDVRAPKEMSSPDKNYPGVSRTVFTHVSNMHRFICDWIRVQEKGAQICKTISALKLHECEEDYYPRQLKLFTNSLTEALSSLKNVVDGISMISSQLQALTKLQPTEQPVMSTWSVRRISDAISKITDSLQKEYRLKKAVAENIAHCRDENLIEVYVSSWECDVCFNLDDCAYLFVEVGLPSIHA